MTNEEEPALLVSSSDGGDDDARRRRNNDTTTVKPIDGKYIKYTPPLPAVKEQLQLAFFSLRFCHRETLRGWEFQRSSNGEV